MNDNRNDLPEELAAEAVVHLATIVIFESMRAAMALGLVFLGFWLA